MNRRTALTLPGAVLIGLAVTALLPQSASAQSSPLIGTWKLNLDKSKYSPGPAPSSATLTYAQDGQNIKNTSQTNYAAGNSTTVVFMHIYDGQPHPSTGSPVFDASTYNRLDPNTYIFSRLKGGKLVGVGWGVVSPDGKTWTVTQTGPDVSGRPTNSVAVYDKQ
jgi:hypothetical protein